ncbi:MAG: DUF1045 domain-containing protein [Candidatus Competibacterales bacterium]
MIGSVAVCFAPAPDSQLWQVGCRWLGRDAASGECWHAPPADDIDLDEWRHLTTGPRDCGFQAPLKPDFALRAQYGIQDLAERLEAVARQQKPFFAPQLTLGNLGGFLALVFSAPCPEMDDLAALCVQEFDGFRDPTATEPPEPSHKPLTPRQLQLLDCWGHPFVFDEFRFHLALTGPIDRAERPRLRGVLAPVVAPLCRDPLRVDTLSLFAQPARGQAFYLHRRCPLGH